VRHPLEHCRALLAGGALLLAGCAGETFAPDAAPEFLVKHPQSPVYRLGPQQPSPPEARLDVNERVRMLRREFGYSLVQLADGRTGYIANDDVTAAPAQAAPRSTPEPASSREPGSQSRSREMRSATPVEPPLPKPDLEAPPPDSPATSGR
jgi:hypothetical protein